jgi:threonyl-tRNA synthetase
MSSPIQKSQNLEALRHSTSHIMASAVKSIFPDAKLAIGPTIENGFYYDFDLPKTLKPEDLPKIEKRMQEIIKQNLAFERFEKPFDEAMKMAESQPYKKELIQELWNQRKPISFYKTGNFVDLCAGPHVQNTKEIKYFKLLSIAGAYWRGNEKNKMLQRIYGTAFESKKELDAHLKKLEKIEESDHRLLNNALKLFSIEDQVGAGLILWHPHGAIIRNEIEKFWKEEHQKRGYQYIYTPHIGKSGLWQKSGHLQFFRENMYRPMEVDKVQYLIKPMNCPFHILVFQSEMRSYKDLPIRYCELGTVYRYERAGTLHGLLRVRGFTQDDAHIFCRPDQLEQEIIGVLDLAIFMLKSFGFKEYRIELSVRDPYHKERYLGSDGLWKQAEVALEGALKKKKLDYKITPGEAIFYGPKIDIQLIDSLGRKWQGPTTQVDFNFPEKFEVNFINKGGNKERAVMIHRTVLGSMERFLGSLLEHYAGNLPLWLSPIHIQIIPVGSKHIKFSQKLAKEFEENGLRVSVDDVNETVGYKIRKAEKQKIPYMLVIGDKEMKAKSLAVRERGKKQVKKIALKKFVKQVQDLIEKKK